MNDTNNKLDNDLVDIQQDSENLLIKEDNNKPNNIKTWMIYINSFVVISCRIYLELKDNILYSMIRDIKFNRTVLEILFKSHIVQELLFFTVGFGVDNCCKSLLSKYYGKKKFKEMGDSYNLCCVFLLIWSIVSFLFIFFGKSFLELTMSYTDIDLLHTYLIHSYPGIIISFFNGLLINYYMGQNNYYMPFIFDSFSILFQFLVTFLFLTFFKESFDSSENDAIVIIAWLTNLVYLLVYLLYYIHYKFFQKFSKENFGFRKEMFRKTKKKLMLTFEFIFFYVTFYIFKEALSYLIMDYYGDDKTPFICFILAIRIYSLIAKFSTGCAMALMTFIGNMILSEKHLIFTFIRNFIIKCFSINLFLCLIACFIASPIVSQFAYDDEIKQQTITYFRILLICLVLHNLQLNYQYALGAFQKQKAASITSLIVSVVGIFSIGYLLIYFFDLGIFGAIYTKIIVEAFLVLVVFYFYYKFQINF